MFITTHGYEAIQPSVHMYRDSQKALTDLTKVSLAGVSSYFQLAGVLGHAGDHMLNVALWQPEGVDLSDPELQDIDATLWPRQMPIWAISKVVDSQRVTIGADIAAKTFAASVETFEGSNSRTEVWQVQSMLGCIMARDMSDVGTLAKHSTPDHEQVYYPFNHFSQEMLEDASKVTRGFLFGMQEVASALLAATSRPTLEK